MDAPICHITPIVKLPQELLASIFEAVREAKSYDELMYSKLTSGRKGHTGSFEITISHVNRRFREVALATAKLWSWIRVEGTNRSMEGAKVYLKRSRNHLVDIHCEARPSTGQGYLEEFVDHIVPHLSHCRSLCVLAYEETFWPEFIRIFRDIQAPEITALHVEHTGEFSENHGASYPSLFVSDMPGLTSLRTMCVKGAPFQCTFSNLHTLRTLHVDQATLKYGGYEYYTQNHDIFWTMLQGHQSLQCLVLTGKTVLESGGTAQTLSLPFLKTLILKTDMERVGSDWEMGYILAYLVAPTLEKIIIETSEPDHVALRLHLLSPERGYQPAVRKLSIKSPRSPNLLFRLAEMYSDVTHLHLLLDIRSSFIDHIQALQDDPNEIPFWPNLHTLTDLAIPYNIRATFNAHKSKGIHTAVIPRSKDNFQGDNDDLTDVSGFVLTEKNTVNSFFEGEDSWDACVFHNHSWVGSH